MGTDEAVPPRAAVVELSLFLQREIETPGGDQLNDSGPARRLCQQLMGCSQGTVVAVHGDWGRGKTSFLRMMRHELELNYPASACVIWVPLWAYEKEIEILRLMRREMRRQIQGWFALAFQWVRFSAGSLWQSMLAVLGSFSLNLPFGGQLKPVLNSETFDLMDKRAREASDLWMPNTEKLRKTINRMLSRKKNAGKRVFVLIDDVDRCDPDEALRLLENIKLLLSCPECHFVLAVDLRVLREAVAAKYAKLSYRDPEQLAVTYLDKCVDLYVELPEIALEDADRYVKRIEAHYVEKFALRPEERFALLAGAPLNPRALKLALGKLRLLDDCPDGNPAEEYARRVKALVLQTFYPKVWTFLTTNPAVLGAIEHRHPEAICSYPTSLEEVSKVRGEWVLDAHSRFAEAVSDHKQDGEMLRWIHQYCPHLLGFVANTPPLDGRADTAAEHGRVTANGQL